MSVRTLIYSMYDVLRKRDTTSYHLKTEVGLFESSFRPPLALVCWFNPHAGKPKETHERDKSDREMRRAAEKLTRK